jgi:Allene oxide cyclase barrel like domain
MSKQAFLLAALAAVLTPGPASAATQQTIAVTSVTVSLSSRDVGPKGASAGDSVTYRDRLLNAAPQFGRKRGAVVGSDHGRLTYSTAHTATYEGTVTLPGGTMELAGSVLSTPAGGLVVPIVGGTGKYAYARGTLTVGPGRDRVLNTYRIAIQRPVA